MKKILLVAVGFLFCFLLLENQRSTASFAIAASQPLSATVPINGRVFSVGGRGIAGARIELTDSNGNVRTAQSNAFGFYRFAAVPVGSTYFVSVRHKRYQFMLQVVNLNEAVEMNFTPMNK